MHGFRFRSWQVYKDAKVFRLEIITIAKRFPAEERFVLADQAMRAATSIVLNIAEGANRNTDKDRRSYLNRAHGSLDEIVACLDCAHDSKYIDEIQLSEMFIKAENIGKQLRGFSAFLRSSRN